MAYQYISNGPGIVASLRWVPDPPAATPPPAPAPAAAAPTPQAVVIPDAKADTGYQQSIANTARVMADFKTGQGLARSQYDNQEATAARNMGWQQGQNSGQGQFDRYSPGAYGDAYNANEGDFAGRGMLHSGAYGTTTGDITRDFATRKTALDTARTDNVNTQGQALGQQQGNVDAINSGALSDAVNRIAAQYAITPQQVPQGSTSTIYR